MTLKKPHTLRTLDTNEAPDLDDNLETLYRNKLESRYHYAGSSTAAVIHAFQSLETGVVGISAAGAGVNAAGTYPLQDSKGTITYASCMAQHSAIIAYLTDVTNTSISIEVGIINFDLSDITTGAVVVRWQVINSSP